MNPIFLNSNLCLDAGLLDIGKDMDKVTGHEKDLYLDQKDQRRFRLSEEIEEIDEHYDQIQQSLYEAAVRAEKQNQDDMRFLLCL